MCAPGSKYAQNLNALFTVQVFIALYMKLWYGFMNPFIVEQSTISANTWFSELPSAASAQGKWVLSEEVRDEISAVHGYSMALARADLSHGSNIFLLTALGYSQSVTCATERHAVWSSYVEFMNGLDSVSQISSGSSDDEVLGYPWRTPHILLCP